MKNAILFLFTLHVFFSLAVLAQTATLPDSGDGSSGNPYHIATLNNLYWIAEDAGRWSSNYIQTADINASETHDWSGGGWTPIGNTPNFWTGTYDGQKYIIDSLYISRSGNYYQGLFGYTHGTSIIKNVYLTNVNITGGDYTGALIGRSGYTAAYPGGTIVDCYSSGIVYPSNIYGGGLIGTTYNTTVERCYSTCNVSGGNGYIGGLIGFTSGPTSVSNCYSRGNVSINGYVGGLVGVNDGATIDNCYSCGSVSSYSGGGLIGNIVSGSVNNCFWDTETSGQGSSAGGTGKTTTAMKTQSTFTGWDFATTPIWQISEGNTYPSLKWQGDGALPVELSSFTATATSASAALTWKTITEVNNYGFEIERRKISNQQLAVSNWKKVGFVKGNGNSNTPNEYSYTDSKLASGRYDYRLKQIDNNGSFKYSQSVEVAVQAPEKFELGQNYPNPFNPTTVIRFDIPNVGTRHAVSLRVYDILGKEVATLVNETKEAGSYSIEWNASRFASGIYFYRLESEKNSLAKKLLLVK